jgi:glutamate/tyrosine decarboxylase-like PLP-dependent enzyme
MNIYLENDLLAQDELLAQAVEFATTYLHGINEHLPDQPMTMPSMLEIANSGIGSAEAMSLFKQRFEPYLTASAGPRYWGYVVGGVTPASLMGDWITSAIDQLPAGEITVNIELESIKLLRELLRLPDSFHGNYTSGASMAEFSGLVVGREWIGRQKNISITDEGIAALGDIRVLSATPHSSIYKGLAMSGIGRNNLVHINTAENRECIDISALERALVEVGEPCIVVANAGTVNTGDFDDIEAIAKLKNRFPFWLHIDAAFGAYAACIDSHKHLIKGWEDADSIAIDAHKWLNVPYDCGIHLNRHLDLHTFAFGQSHADYLDKHSAQVDNFINMTPELSRRIRGISVWFSLIAYGRTGIEDIVNRNCQQAVFLADWVRRQPNLELLAEPYLNICCFTLRDQKPEVVKKFLGRLNATGKVFMSPTNLKGKAAIRAAFCNWRTTMDEVTTVIQVMENMLR